MNSVVYVNTAQKFNQTLVHSQMNILTIKHDNSVIAGTSLTRNENLCLLPLTYYN